MANSVDPDQTVLSPRCLLLYLIHQYSLAIICGRRLQQTTFSDAVFLGALRVNTSVVTTVWAGKTSSGSKFDYG